MIKISLHIYDRKVREVHDYGGYREVEEFARRIAGTSPHTVSVDTVDNELTGVYMEFGRHSKAVEIVIPQGKISKLIELTEPIKKAIDGDEVDFIDAVSVIYQIMQDMLTLDENYIDVRIKIEHSESEGLKEVASLFETYG